MTVSAIVAEPIDVWQSENSTATDARGVNLLQMVGLDPSLRRRYPHQFSGDKRQRIGIARALAAKPDFIVADESRHSTFPFRRRF